jgi:hypothetical protein
MKAPVLAVSLSTSDTSITSNCKPDSAYTQASDLGNYSMLLNFWALEDIKQSPHKACESDRSDATLLPQADNLDNRTTFGGFPLTNAVGPTLADDLLGLEIVDLANYNQGSDKHPLSQHIIHTTTSINQRNALIWLSTFNSTVVADDTPPPPPSASNEDTAIETAVKSHSPIKTTVKAEQVGQYSAVVASVSITIDNNHDDIVNAIESGENPQQFTDVDTLNPDHGTDSFPDTMSGPTDDPQPVRYKLFAKTKDWCAKKGVAAKARWMKFKKTAKLKVNQWRQRNSTVSAPVLSINIDICGERSRP